MRLMKKNRLNKEKIFLKTKKLSKTKKKLSKKEKSLKKLSKKEKYFDQTFASEASKSLE